MDQNRPMDLACYHTAEKEEEEEGDEDEEDAMEFKEVDEDGIDFIRSDSEENFDDELRNLIWATSKHDIYFVHDSSGLHWSPLTVKTNKVLNVAGALVPASQVVLQPLMGQMQISSMHVHNNLLVAGGVDGELVCKYLDQSEVSFSIKSTFDESAIKNAIEIDEDSGIPL